MAHPFWTVLGRACAQDAYRRSLRENAAPKAADMVDASALHGFLADPGMEGPEPREGYPMTRYEVMELNAVLLAPLGSVGETDAISVGDQGGPMTVISARVEELWGGTPENPAVWQVIGLSIVDRPFRDALQSAAVTRDKEAFQTILSQPPGFALSEDDRGLLLELLQDESVRNAIARVEHAGWRIIDPPAACSTGGSCTSLYVHDRVADDPGALSVGGALIASAKSSGSSRCEVTVH